MFEGFLFDFGVSGNESKEAPKNEFKMKYSRDKCCLHSGMCATPNILKA